MQIADSCLWNEPFSGQHLGGVYEHSVLNQFGLRFCGLDCLFEHRSDEARDLRPHLLPCIRYTDSLLVCWTVGSWGPALQC